MVYNARPDSAELLDPYVDDLIRMLDDPVSGLRATAASVLGGAYPTPSDRSVAALMAHLSGKNNSVREFEAFSNALLRARPEDVSIVRAVVAGAARYANDSLD